VEDWLKPENVKALTQLVLPGFVIAYVRSQLVPVRRIELKDAILGYLALSFLYQAILAPFRAVATAIISLPSPIWPWLVSWHLQGLLSARSAAIGHSFALALTSLLLPAGFGLLLGLDVAKGWSQNFLKERNIHFNHPIETAWDWRLGQEECWVHVKLKDGTKWAGHLGTGSFSSTDPTERDLYIDDVYSTGEGDRNWKRRGSGVWIAHGEIQTIEFWPNEQDGNAETSEAGQGIVACEDERQRLEGVTVVETPRRD
jgi:hypothetical protein